MLEDKADNIWFGTTDGICRFDGKSFTSFPINDFVRPANENNNYYTKQSTKNSVWSMLQDKNGTIWFGTGDGVYCYNGLNFSRFLYLDGVINNDSLKLKMVASMVER